jgi:hypothetical protein
MKTSGMLTLFLGKKGEYQCSVVRFDVIIVRMTIYARDAEVVLFQKNRVHFLIEDPL